MRSGFGALHLRGWRAGPPALLSLLALSFATVLAPAPARAIPPGWSATLSLLAPGLGQILNRNVGEGVTHAVVWAVMSSEYLRLSEDEDFIEFDDRVDEENKTIATNRTTFLADLYAFGSLNLSFYSGFDAYRDARLATDNAGYRTPAPSETITDLALAPFDWQHLKRPTTWAPLAIPLVFLLIGPDEDTFIFQPDNTISREEMAAGFFAMHEMVAIGEEAFFRGVLNNGLSSAWGRTWGLVASSAIFGLAHQGDAGQATALGAGGFGAYVGYLQQRNDYKIGQGVAIHFWWNFVTSLAMLRTRDSQRIVPLYSYFLRY